MHQLILASQSPRRRELLQERGFVCRVDTVKVSEIIDENLNLEAAVEAIARDKARALVNTGKYMKGHGFVILAADTMVVVDSQVLGKPGDPNEAKQFLRLLSGREHRVITGLCVYDVDRSQYSHAHDTTWVQFRALSVEDIERYVASGEPFDKAGGYAIQGLGRELVSTWRGSYSNVVGLPLELWEKMIERNGWQFPRGPHASPA